MVSPCDREDPGLDQGNKVCTLCVSPDKLYMQFTIFGDATVIFLSGAIFHPVLNNSTA